MQLLADVVAEAPIIGMQLFQRRTRGIFVASPTQKCFKLHQERHIAILKGLNHSARRCTTKKGYAGELDKMKSTLNGLKRFVRAGDATLSGLENLRDDDPG